MRKKDNKHMYYKVYTIFPIFTWKKCDICEYFFKLEKGYEINSIHLDDVVYTYCNKCIKSKQEVEELWIKEMSRVSG